MNELRYKLLVSNEKRPKICFKQLSGCVQMKFNPLKYLYQTLAGKSKPFQYLTMKS